MPPCVDYYFSSMTAAITSPLFKSSLVPPPKAPHTVLHQIFCVVGYWLWRTPPTGLTASAAPRGKMLCWPPFSPLQRALFQRRRANKYLLQGSFFRRRALSYVLQCSDSATSTRGAYAVRLLQRSSPATCESDPQLSTQGTPAMHLRRTQPRQPPPPLRHSLTASRTDAIIPAVRTQT